MEQWLTMEYACPFGRTLTLACKGDALTAVIFNGQRYAGEHIPADAAACPPGKEPDILRKACQWLERYFAGENPDCNALTLVLSGTAYQKRVWEALRRIPYGCVISYGRLAEQCGGSARSVGAAVGHNPVSIIIPCHRVIHADGTISGYAAGTDIKSRLLLHEGVKL